MVFRRKKKNFKSQWEKQVTQVRKQTKGQLNRMAQEDRYYEDDPQADIERNRTYDQSYGVPYYSHNGGESLPSRNMSHMDDGTNTYDGMNTHDGDGTYTYDGMNTYEGNGTIPTYQGSANNTYDGMNTYEGDGNNTYDGMNSYQGSAINTYDGMDSHQESAINTYDGMNSYQGSGVNMFGGMNSHQGSAINTYDGMDSYQGSAINTYDGMNSHQESAINTYDGTNSYQGSGVNMFGGMNSHQGSAINTYDGMDSYQGSGVNNFGGGNGYQGSGINTYNGIDSYQQGSGANLFGQTNPYGQTDSFQHGGMTPYQDDGMDGMYGRTEDAHDNRHRILKSRSYDGSILKKGSDRQITRKNSFRKGLKKIAKIGGKKKDKDDPSFMTLPTPDTYMDPDARDDGEDLRKIKGKREFNATSNDGDTLTMMRRMQLKEEANKAASSHLINELLSNPVLACAAAPVIPCLVCYTKCFAPSQTKVEHREYNENQPQKSGTRNTPADLESINDNSYQENYVVKNNHGRNISGTFEEHGNISGTFDNNQAIRPSHSRSSRGDIDSRASEFSRILSVAASGDRSLGLNSRATEFSNIISDAGKDQPWKKKSSSFNSRKTEYSAIQSTQNRRPHTVGSLSKASTKVSEFSRIDSKSKASEFSRIDSNDNDHAWQARETDDGPGRKNNGMIDSTGGGGTYGNSTNQSGSRRVPRTGNLWGGDDSASGKSGKISKLTFDGTYGGDVSSGPGGSRRGNLWNNYSQGTGTGAGDASDSRGGSKIGSLWNNFSGVTSGKNSSKYTAENQNYSYASQGSYGAGKWANTVNDTFSKAGDGDTYASQSNGGSRFTDNNDDDSYTVSAIEDDAGTVHGTIGTFDDDVGYSYRSQTQATTETPEPPRRRNKSPFKKMFKKKARE